MKTLAAVALALLVFGGGALAQSRGRISGGGTSAAFSTQVSSTFVPLVSNGTANFYLNQVANSAPAMANYGGSLEFGGLGTAGNSDGYFGALWSRSSGNIFSFMNKYGNAGGTELEVWHVAWDGDVVQNGHLTVGANKSDGRLQSSAGSLYTISAAGPQIVWNKGAQDVAQYFTGVGGTQVGSISTAGRVTAQSLGVTAAGTGTANVLISGTAPTITGFGGTGATVSFNNGTLAFDINVGTVAPGNTGTITLPAATTGWICNCYNKTTTTSVNVIRVTSDTATTCVIAQVVASTNGAANWAASDHLRCTAIGL